MDSRLHPPHEGLQVWETAGSAQEVTNPSDEYEKFVIIESPGHPARRICGLAARTVWVVIGIVVCFIVGAAVGGGVGAALAERHTKDAAVTR